jgi:uncharacterized protein DUF4382
MQSKFWIALALAVGLTVAVVAGTMYYLPQISGKGTLVAEVHDAPCPDCSHVWVTFSSVSVHASNGSGGGWTTINANGSTVDLLALNGTALAKVIGVATLSAGQYEQVRLAVTNVSVMLANGTTVAAFVPNASSADVNGAFNISSGGTTTISIDVDLGSSLHVVWTGLGVKATFTPNIGSVVVV